MKAVVYDRYGPPEVQRLEDVERPVAREDEVLVKIHATTVTRTDVGVREGKPFPVRLFFGLLRPRQRILGTELAGEVVSIGAAVHEFAVGDRVFGSTAAFRSGTHAEFICMRESDPLAHMPAGMTFEAAAAGLPVLVSHLYGVNEFLVDGKNGYLIDTTAEGVRTGLQRLLASSAQERRSVGAQAASSVRSYGLDAFLNGWKKVYAA